MQVVVEKDIHELIAEAKAHPKDGSCLVVDVIQLILDKGREKAAKMKKEKEKNKNA